MQQTQKGMPRELPFVFAQKYRIAKALRIRLKQLALLVFVIL
jgi:hypothetical protein